MVLVFVGCGPSEEEMSALSQEYLNVDGQIEKNKERVKTAIAEIKALEKELAELKEGGAKILAKLKSMNIKEDEYDMVDPLKELFSKHPGSDASLEAVAIADKMSPVWRGFVDKVFRKKVK